MKNSLLPILGLVMALAAGPASAAPACRPPAGLSPWPVETPQASEVADVATVFYLLTLSWTPEWCRINGQTKATAQKLDCDGPAAFGFSLHGLWPNGHGQPYPRYCRPVGQVDVATLKRMYCRTPSAELLQHEWQAHGGCGWTDPRMFFARGAKLYDRIRPPRIETIAPDALTAGALRRAFVARNPWLKPDGIFVATDKEDRLTEVRLCYDLKFHPTACPDGLGAADSVVLKLTPSRTRGF